MKKSFFLTNKFALFLFVFFLKLNLSAQTTISFSVTTSLDGHTDVVNNEFRSPTDWGIEYGPVGFLPGEGTLISNLSSPSYRIQINQFIKYDFRIANYNGQGWSQTLTTNLCTDTLYSTGYTNDFNNVSPTVVNSCWKGYTFPYRNYNDYDVNVHVNNDDNHSGTGASINLKDIGNNSDGVVFVSPKFNDLSTDKKIKFWVKNYYGGGLKVGTMSNPDDMTTFHLLSNVSVETDKYSWEEKTVFLNNYQGTDQYVVFKFASIYDGSTEVSIDDFSYEQSVNCFDPTNVNLTNITEHTAQLNFTAPGQNSWEVSLKYATTGIGPEQFFTTTNNPYIFNNLSGNTAYEVKIRANCATDLYSNWSPVISLTTTCDVITAGYATSFLETTYLDPCWKTIKNGNDIFQAPIDGNANIIPRTGSRYIEMSNVFSSSTQMSYLVTPYIGDLDNTKRVNFYLKSYGGTVDYNNNTLTIGTMSDPSDETTFVPLKTISPLEMNEIAGFQVNSNWKQHIINLDSYDNTQGHNYIALKRGTLGGTFYIDDFAYQAIPLCQEPTNLKSTAVEYDTATLMWDNNGVNATEWEIEYGVQGFVQGTGTIINATSNPFTINTGLAGYTNYQFYVRAKCGADFSNWSDKGSFKTRCFGFNAGYTTSFNSDNLNTNSSCWRRLSPLIRSQSYAPSTFIDVNNYYVHTGAKSVYFNNNYSSGETDVNLKTILVSPRLIDFDQFKKINFWARITNPAQIVIGTLSNPNDHNSFTPFKTLSGIATNTWTQLSVDFSAYTGTDKYIGIRYNQDVTGNGTMAIDDFEYLQNDCTKPNNLQAFQSESNGVTLSWNTNNTINPPTSWEIEYGEFGFAPGTGTVITVNTNPFILNGLNMYKKYQYRVRNICGNGQLNWSDLYSFRITCMINVPFYENFDQYDANENYDYTGNGITNFCWYSEDFQKAGLNFHYLNNINSSPNSGFIYHEETDGVLISPYLADFDNTKRIKFWINQTTTIGNSDENVRFIIGTMKNPTDFSTFEDYQTISILDLPSYGKEFNVDFSGYTGQNKHIAFRIENTSDPLGYHGKRIYIDNIYYDVIPTCYEPLDIKFLNINNNSTLVKWINTNASQNIEIEYGVSGFALGSGTVVNTTLDQILITGLSSSTTYDFYFKTICSSQQSIVVGSKKITTTCNIEPLPWAENFNGLSQYGNNILPDCFKYLEGNFDLKNTPETGSSGYNYDPISGYDDTTYLHFYNNFSSKIFTPLFNLTAGTTYKFSLKIRKSYEYSTMNMAIKAGRGQEEHYMETPYLNRLGTISEDQYNNLDHYYTPIESGDYSFLMYFSYPGGVNMIADNFELQEGYEGLINDYTTYDFSSAPDTSLILEKTMYSDISLTNLSGNNVLKLSGSSDDSEFKNSGDVWQLNQAHVTKVNMKVNPTTMSGSLYLRFDLKQTYNTSADESMFRVIINGNVVGEIIKPNTSNQDEFVMHQYDLSPYLGTDIKISLQHMGKSTNGNQDNAYLDNIEFSPTLAVNQNEFSGLKFYPNPTNNILNIQNNETISKVQITNINGQLLHNNDYNENAVNLDLSNYNSGIYFVKIFSNNRNKIIKIVKQ